MEHPLPATPWPLLLLCAVDSSDRSSGALKAAIDLAERSSSPLHLVNAWRSQGRGSQGSTGSQQLLAAAQAEATEHGVSATPHSHEGPPSAVIIQVATSIGAQLVIIGGSHRGSLAVRVFGSIVRDMAERCTVPMLVVNSAAPWPPTTVLAGDDGTPSAESAAALGYALGCLYSAPTVLLEAIQNEAGASDNQLAYRRAQAAAHLQQRSQEFGRSEQHGDTPTSQVISGNVATTIADLSSESRGMLVAVGRRTDHARSPTSVSDSLLTDLHGSVLLWPARASWRPPLPS